MAGFGIMGLGSGPNGLGTPAQAAEPASGSAGSRFINPTTRDYERDSRTGQLKQMPRTRQKVLLALLTVRGSIPHRPNFGVRLPKKMGDSYESEVRAAIKEALFHLTNTEKSVRLDGVLVKKGRAGRSEITVIYTDVTSGKPDAVTLSPA